MTDLTTGIPFEYWNKLANQVIAISSLLGGFSIAIIANILVSQNDSRLVKIIMLVSTLAGSFFLVTIFAMTKLLLMTTDGYPFQVAERDLALPRLLGTISFFNAMISFSSTLASFTKQWIRSLPCTLITNKMRRPQLCAWPVRLVQTHTPVSLLVSRHSGGLHTAAPTKPC